MIAYLLTWLELKTDKRAVTAVEYAILAGVVIVALTGLGATFGTKVAAAFSAIGDKMSPS
jgi:pilus assembly protein Flp/PilA